MPAFVPRQCAKPRAVIPVLVASNSEDAIIAAAATTFTLLNYHFLYRHYNGCSLRPLISMAMPRRRVLHAFPLRTLESLDEELRRMRFELGSGEGRSQNQV